MSSECQHEEYIINSLVVCSVVFLENHHILFCFLIQIMYVFNFCWNYSLTNSSYLFCSIKFSLVRITFFISHLGIKHSFILMHTLRKMNICVLSLPLTYCMLFIHKFSLWSLMRKRKYSFRLIQIRFVTSKTTNSVNQYSRVCMPMLICVFQQLVLAKTDGQTKKR
jgi:hypothetical protein